VLAWLLALAGFALGFVIAFAAGMKTVPSLSLRDLVMALPLPLAALALAVPGIVAAVRTRRWARAVGGYGLPAAIAALALLVVLGSASG
jgi:hypothetical protein